MEVERASLTELRSKQNIAMESAQRYFDEQQDRLLGRCRRLTDFLNTTKTPQLREKFQRDIRETEKELERLQQNWENSSLRRNYSAQQAEYSAGHIERRIITTPTAGSRISLPDTLSGKTKLKLNGLAAVFDSLSEDLGFFREKIEYGAFSDCLQDDVRMLHNHDPNYIYGRTTNGTLRLYENKQGLVFWCDLLEDDELSLSLARRVERRDVTQCSFCFTVLRDRWEFGDGLET